MNPSSAPSNVVPHRAGRRGSLLIVAMLLCAIIGVSLVSYLHLSRTALNLSTRAVYNNAAINLAEQGLEEAIYAINQMVANPSYPWNDWNNHSTNNKRRKWENIALGQNAMGENRVYIYNYAGSSNPRIVSRALIRLGGSDSPAVEKWVEVRLAKTSKFANGLVAKSNVTFSGNNASVDSWNSDPENDGVGIRPFDFSLRLDNGSVGSISVATDAVVTWNADVWGYVSTGNTDPTGFVGTNGSILGSGSTNDGTWTKSNVDPTRVSTNFSATFEPVTAPSTTAIAHLGSISTALTLPRASDLHLASGGVYYYDATSISLSGAGNVLTIAENVVLRVTGNVSTTGNGGIRIGSSGSLALYTPGSVNLSGNGVLNGTDTNGSGTISGSELGQPAKFQLWGTSTTAQSISISGTSEFSGVVYAPQGNVSINGNGAVSGSIVANTIALSGTTQFHYDEALGNFGGANPYRVSRWAELTSAADRSVHSSQLSW